MNEFQIENIDSTQYINQTYKLEDTNILNSIQINKEFGLGNDIIEMFILSPSGNILESNYDFKNYKNGNNLENSSLFNLIEVNPEQDLLSYGYDKGQFDVLYNFYRLLFGSSNNIKFFIKEISNDRTEIKLSSDKIVYSDLQSSYLEYIINRNQRSFYSDFILNFGNNKNIIGVNIALDNINTDISSLYIKLYEPLSNDYKIKDQLWVAEIISDPQSYRLNKDVVIESNINNFPLRGPNFDIKINDSISTSTQYLNISNILDSNISSSYNQLASLISDNIQINIDYNYLEEFVHFSSAKGRLENFIFKIDQIQKIENDINILNNLSSSIETGSINNSLIKLHSQIDNITQTFDGYEYFMYYESGSNSFPKTNNTKPYINHNINDNIVLEWLGSDSDTSGYYGGMLLDASNYDNQNRDYIWNNLPEYIKYDSQNIQLELIISMMGQHFDYIWTYVKDITNKNLADNRLNSGISKDLVAETLKSFGIKLYTNSRSNENIYSSLLGVNPDGTFLPQTGSYQITNYVSASNYTIPENDIVKETYKRIYHNLPYLLKSRGTRKGIRALINCFGIPKTILDVKEFGGVIKEQDFIEEINEKFNYALNLNVSGTLEIPFLPSNKQYIDTGYSDIYPDSIEFRFKLNDIYSIQPIFESGTDSKKINITHISGALASINFILGDLLGGEIASPSITLPLYNNDWWNIVWTRENGGIRSYETGSDNKYILTIGNKNEHGIQYLESCSVSIDGNLQSNFNKCWNINDFIYPGSYNNQQSYVMQEFRYWVGSIPVNNIKEHILNPKSISYGNETGSYDNLIFRLPLGSELDNNIEQYLYSVHPSPLSSFIDGVTLISKAELYNYAETTYESNYEQYLINVPNGGNFVESNQKIKIIETETLPDNTLSPIVSIVKKPTYNQVKNSSKIEIGISPQNSINSDIISQLGNFNIDEYIGDPKDSNKTSYKDLNNLKLFYFQKYLKKQDISGTIKLLSYLDNSLFKMVKDFIPGKSILSSGLVIKPHILEKNKIQKFEPNVEYKNIDGNINTAFIQGDNPLNTSFSSNNKKIENSILGNIEISNDDNKELYNGEFFGSGLTIHSSSKSNIIYEENKLSPENVDLYHSYSKIILNPLLNNVEKSKTSKKYLNVDYYSNINTPGNINYITSSLFLGVNNKIINAEIQESNYSLIRHNNPRYNGCKMVSKEYNKYNNGDISYGKQPVIDKNTTKFIYFSEITSQNLTLPGRNNVYAKYFIDEEANITELTRQNQHIFDVQSIYEKDDVDIILDDNQNPTEQKKLDGLISTFAVGYRYEPVYQNFTDVNSSHNHLELSYEEDIELANVSGSSSIENLPLNSLILGSIYPLQAPTISLPKNQVSSGIITSTLDSKLYINVRRNTSYTGEIRQRIVGTIKFMAPISPPTNLKAQIFSVNSLLSGTFNVPQDLIHVNQLATNANFPPAYIVPQDNIGSARIPIGTTAYFYNFNDYTIHTIIVGTGNISPVNYSIGLGVDYIKVTASETNAKITYPWFYNDFGGNVSHTSGSNTYPVEGINSISGDIEFPFEGMIILPKGVNNGDIIIKNISGIEGYIKGQINFENIGTGGIQFTSSPQIITNEVSLPSSPYYNTTPPEYVYIDTALDNGFNPYSNPIENWYFERGNSVISGSITNLLTCSYDLSNIIYNQVNRGNNVMQTAPELFSFGYEDVVENFNIKTGDLVRLWDVNKKSFPINLENEVKTVHYPLSAPVSGTYDNRLVIELKNPIVNQSCLDYPENRNLSKKIQNFIFLSKILDETNIIINKNKKEGQTSSGTILSKNISKSTKDKSGNIIKQLKDQKLI